MYTNDNAKNKYTSMISALYPVVNNMNEKKILFTPYIGDLTLSR